MDAVHLVKLRLDFNVQDNHLFVQLQIHVEMELLQVLKFVMMEQMMVLDVLLVV